MVRRSFRFAFKSGLINRWFYPLQSLCEHKRRYHAESGLWTGVCIVGPALSALDQGFEVYFIADASGDVSSEAHDRAVERMVQAGAHPMTSIQYLLELQRDWARVETYEAVMNVAKKFGGSYGIGITYAKTMLGEHASEAGPAAQAV